MNTYIVIQARTTSTRLPKKVLLPLGDKTVLETMLKRLEEFKDNIIIATTNDGTQEEIVNICKKHKIKYYEGDTNNVLSRYYESCLKYELKDDDIVIRCTSDCPFIDAKLIQKAINLYKTSKADYVSLGVHSGFPRGLDTEVFSFKLLTQAYNNATTDYEKEHVTIYMHTTIKDKLKIEFLKSFEDNSKYRITLDEIADYEAIKKLYEKFGNKEEFSYEKLISTLKDNPEIFEINKFVEQKKR
ncbi:cytidylyltransferase domain-containing protein [Arcobacter sp. CECT 8985]|uniref:cytidylyltransferase domain-containing protein n=1 Tax=Arcobacter sp. CECT 8985 TaxID=1935424 RepID=UPI00100A946E|nr:glycosyltransferase family protein [Arcobacter sp. CECT 8985]RXJ86221.1 polysaccharide biosynthesis protein [Arcobacter sp. CECT 8985]